MRVDRFVRTCPIAKRPMWVAVQQMCADVLKVAEENEHGEHWEHGEHVLDAREPKGFSLQDAVEDLRIGSRFAKALKKAITKRAEGGSLIISSRIN